MNSYTNIPHDQPALTLDVLLETYARSPVAASVALWSNEIIRAKAERWEELAIGQANMPIADYIEAAMREVRDSHEAQLGARVGIPREVAQTMREALSGTRMRAINLTRWDDAHTARVDAALAWLATVPPSASVPRDIAETIVRWAELLHALVMDTREHNIDVSNTLRKEIAAVLGWLSQHAPSED